MYYMYTLMQLYGTRADLIGLHATADINNLDVVDSLFHGSHLFGAIVISGGMQVRLTGNVLEGFGGPAMVINDVYLLVPLSFDHDHSRVNMAFTPSIDSHSHQLICFSSDEDSVLRRCWCDLNFTPQIWPEHHCELLRR